MNTTLALGGAKNSVSSHLPSKPPRHDGSRIKQMIDWLLRSTPLSEGNSEGLSNRITVYFDDGSPSIVLTDVAAVNLYVQRNGYTPKNKHLSGEIVYGVGPHGKFCTLIKDEKRK